MTAFLNLFLGLFGVELLRNSTAADLRAKRAQLERCTDELGLIHALRNYDVAKVLENWSDARSQLGQDLFVLAVLGFKKSGYFVEFGATDGVSLSNSWLLEKKFGWSGILAEPSQFWQKSLRSNRKATIDSRCVWKTSNDNLPFLETDIGELSTLASFSNSDHHASTRLKNKTYSVPTISLVDLLAEHDAPSTIDYLSIDTEGSELEILEVFDFTKYTFRVITCEHNYTGNRELIHKLLNQNGYRRVLESSSKWDDWYLHESVTADFEINSFLSPRNQQVPSD